MADMRVGSEAAFFITGDANLGLPTTSGLSWLLPRLVGDGRARWLTMVEPRVSGAEAHAMGLVEVLCPAGEALAHAIEMAATVAAKPGDGIRLTRRTINGALESGYVEAIDAELVAQREAFANPAVRQAIDAFFHRLTCRTMGAEGAIVDVLPLDRALRGSTHPGKGSGCVGCCRFARHARLERRSRGERSFDHAPATRRPSNGVRLGPRRRRPGAGPLLRRGVRRQQASAATSGRSCCG